MTRPATISRRGFLRALGITATTVLLGDVVNVEAVERKIETSTSITVATEGNPLWAEVVYRFEGGKWQRTLVAQPLDGVRLPMSLLTVAESGPIYFGFSESTT